MKAGKLSIFYKELRSASSRNIKGVLREPGKLLRYARAFFNYDMGAVDTNTRSMDTASACCLFGDFEELHDRIAGREGDYKDKISSIGSALSRKQPAKISVGISRYNFGRLHKICEHGMALLGEKADLPGVGLEVFPVKDLPRNFIAYVEALKQGLDPQKIELVIHDDELMDILKTVGLHAQVNGEREKDLLRLLGVISEQVFIGPQTIVFDPYHRCNTRCKHCWVHTPGVSHPEEFLDRRFDLEIFKRIIDDASEMKVDGIILQGDGEPLIYDKFMPMLRYAKSRDLGVLFFTNGILLDKEKSKEVIDLGVNEIYCSFPAGTAVTYEKISSVQPAETFYKVRDNLKSFMSLRRGMNKPHPRLIISHVIHNMNYHELIEMARMDADIAPDAVRFYLIRLDVMNRFLQLEPRQIEEIKRQVPEISRVLKESNIEFVDNFGFQLDNYDEKTGAWSKDFFLKHGCNIGWYFNLIPAKYDMSFCCHLRTVGCVDRQSFKEIWNSVDYWRWRRQAKYLKDNKYAKFANGQALYDEHCDHCDNHQTIIRNLVQLKKYGLDKYY